MKPVAVLYGKEYRLKQCVPIVGQEKEAILCVDSTGKEYFCAWEDWSRASFPAPAPTPAPSGASQPAMLTKHSDFKQRAAFILDLFHGRRDVYACAYVPENGRPYYSFDCANRWNPDCPKARSSWKSGSKSPCAGCALRKELPLTEEVLQKHMTPADPGKKAFVAGVYPMLPDSTTRFLALDLDKQSWKEDVTALRETCQELSVIPAVERSRSGNGAHIWFFFTEPVPAARARRFGEGLLTRTMERCSALGFGSYDRMFPNQDLMPAGGLGNLIALPFQGTPGQKGNSVFIDENFVPYRDQYVFLSSVPRLTPEDLDALLDRLGISAGVGTHAGSQPETAPEPSAPQGKKRRAYIRKTLNAEDFPARLHVVQAGFLEIPTNGLSATAVNELRRLAVFENPKFIDMQQTRQPIWFSGKANICRFVECYEEDETTLYLPRGCLEPVQKMLFRCHVPLDLEDRRTDGRPIEVRFRPEHSLRVKQETVAMALLESEIGILSAGTGFGKTVVATWIISQLRVSTLVLVPSSALLGQWLDAFEEFLDVPEDPAPAVKTRGRHAEIRRFGQYGDGKKELTGIVDVAILQSMSKSPDDPDTGEPIINQYGLILVDECHHIAAETFEKVIRQAPARHVYGLSATPRRTDRKDPILFMQCGPIRHEVSAKSLAEERPFTHIVIPRFTSLRLPGVTDFKEMKRAVMDSAVRNELILSDARAALAEGRTPLVLTGLVKHAQALAEQLQGAAQHVLLLKGSSTPAQKKARLEELKAIPPDESLIVVATQQYIGEGFDAPRLDTLLFAMPIKSENIVAQCCGRLHRNYEGKTEVRVLDYADLHVRKLRDFYNARMKEYAHQGYLVGATEDPEARGIIYDSESYFDTFREDLETAERSIWIISPHLDPARTESLLPVFQKARQAGVQITLHTQLPDGKGQKVLETIRKLKKLGAEVLTERDCHPCCAILDASVVWNGGIHLLGPSDQIGEDVIRFLSPDVAGELRSEADTLRNGSLSGQMEIRLG